MATILACGLWTLNLQYANGQSKLYPQHFDLEEVVMLDGPFHDALVTNCNMLLQYDADRLMCPFVRESGLSKKSGSKYYNWTSKHPSFGNWGQSDWSLEGHVGGHYISALAMGYAATKNDPQCKNLNKLLLNKLNYCLNIMKDCQNAYDGNTEGMEGFIGGQPITHIWTAMYANNIQPYKQYGGWVPFYCQHKVLAGVRDAWVYAGSEMGKEMFRKLADWSVNVVSKLNDNDMQNVLGNEHGGMNETLADAYKIFGDIKYLNAAKKYSHSEMINGMQSLNTTFLNNRHANTQVPKYIGFERIYQLKKSETTYKTAAQNFWDDVANNRTVCIGGNSVDEHFLNQGNCGNYINSLNGPETCNTNNMLKLTEDLFDDTHNGKYADFYENAMYNHILSTQDPETGGYVYFTTLRPQGYKIYSQVNKGMWCCVGTGMENHNKYNHFIYTYQANSSSKTLYVNLFTASHLIDSLFDVTQETRFPYEEGTKLTVNTAGEYTIAVRHPSWTTADFAIRVNGEAQTFTARKGLATYIKLKREWAKGDVIEIDLPMELRYEQCPNVKEYIAFKYGPILLGAKTNTSDMKNEYAGEGRMDHAPGNMAPSKSILSSPLLICNRSEVLNRIKKEGELKFTIDASRKDASTYWSQLTLEPFFSLHHSRYMIYWYQQTAEEFAKSSLAAEEQKSRTIIDRTLDYVGTGEQQSEVGHKGTYSEGSTYGSYNGEIYRDAQRGGFIQYTLSNKEGLKTDLSVMCRFTTADKGRSGNIYIEGTKIATYTIPSSYPSAENGFFNIEFPIPDELLVDAQGKVKSELVFKIEANNSICPGLYYLRLLKGYSERFKSNYQFVAEDWSTTGDGGRVSQNNISFDAKANTITVNATGQNNVCLGFSSTKYSISTGDIYFIIRAQNVSTADGSAYLWWFNGTNKGSSVKPTKVTTEANGDVTMYWDITKSGLDDRCTGEMYDFSQGQTIFGLTSTTGTSIIKYIGFNSEMVVPSSIKSITMDKKLTSSAIYDMNGRELTSIQKGINIIGGKKVLVK